MAIYPQRLTIYLYSAHRAVIFAIAQLSCYIMISMHMLYHITKGITSLLQIESGTLPTNIIKICQHWT